MNELHEVVYDGSVENTVNVLSRGVVDIDEGAPDGTTALMIAAGFGHSHIVRILLNHGANMSFLNNDGWTALHFSVLGGHPAVTKLLVSANLESGTAQDGSTPLHLAAQGGKLEIMSVLMEAGANPNSRRWDGGTPLYVAAQQVNVDAIKLLLRAKANPQLFHVGPSGVPFVPLDMAVHHDHAEIVHELIQEHGIEGCGGVSGGVTALEMAVLEERLGIMAVLTSAGVVDNGFALAEAAGHGREASAKYLLQQKQGGNTGSGAYADSRNRLGVPVLFLAIEACLPRMVRLLVDAGATTSTLARVKRPWGNVIPGGDLMLSTTPVGFATDALRVKCIAGKTATEDQLHRLEAIRRLLLRVGAVHAVSWLWPSDVPSIVRTEEGARIAGRTSTALTRMLPTLRRRTRRRGMLLAAILRWEKAWGLAAILGAFLWV